MQASIQKIKSIKPAKNSNNLELAEVLGWQAVVQKGKHHVGESIVFVEIDSIVPGWLEYKFLKGNNRIKTAELRGNISQGLVMGLQDYFTVILHDVYRVGFDMTGVLKIKKYEKPAPKCQDAAGPFPDLIPKTGEINIQSEPGLIDELKGKPYCITQKIDGCSCTICNHRGHFGVCSRNMELKSGNNPYWNVVREYDYNKAILDIDGVAIQGEIAGPKIQGNPLGLKELQLFIFDVFDIERQEHFNRHELYTFMRKLDSARSYFSYVVPRVVEGKSFDFSIDQLIELAGLQSYSNGKPQEGIVVRPKENVFSETLRGRLSFKVLNPDYKEN